MGTRIVISVVLLGFAVLLLVLRMRDIIKEDRLKSLTDVLAVMTAVLALIVFIMADTFVVPTVTPVPTEMTPAVVTVMPTPTEMTPAVVTVTSCPTARSVPEYALYYDDFETQPKCFTEIADQNGRSWYGDGGYNIESYDTVSGWVWAGRCRSFTDAIVEVEATPLTHGAVTGYGIGVGWEKDPKGGNSYFLFEVTPSGECGFIPVISHQVVSRLTHPGCRLPVQDKMVKLRLEVEGQQMTAFADGECIAQATFTGYHGGSIAFEAKNGGSIGTGVKARVHFDNLVVWPIK